jgi:pilus assembly protein CpaC
MNGFKPWLAVRGALAFLILVCAAPAGAIEAKHTPRNTMLVKIDAGNTHMTQRLRLSLDKAVIVELPVDARDALVSNPKIADAIVRTPRRIYILGLTVGQTNAFFFDAAGQQILNLEISVERDFTTLNAMYERVLPDARITVAALNDNIVLTGFVETPGEADQAREIAGRFVDDPKRVMSMLTVNSSEQVLLKVRVAEMQRTLAKQLGVNLNGAFSVGQFNSALAIANPFSLTGRALSDTLGQVGSLADPTVPAQIDGRNSLGGTVQALERAGLMKTLAEPNLTAISGESAKFLAGGEFPVPVKTDQAGNVSLEFKPFGVGLGFTPVVISGGRISLKISTEVSELTSENSFVASGRSFLDPTTNTVVSIPGLAVPGLRVRRAETTVELPSGGSLVMAGLLQDTIRQNIDGLPGLKDLPILGALFRSRDFQNQETELVVLVTPYLVKPVSAQKLAMPTDGYTPPSDLDAILLGRNNGVHGPDRAVGAKNALKGPVGFVMK